VIGKEKTAEGGPSAALGREATGVFNSPSVGSKIIDRVQAGATPFVNIDNVIATSVEFARGIGILCAYGVCRAREE